MNYRKLRFILSLCVLTLFGGCNSDIFLDEDDLPANTSVTLEGDGGEWSSRFFRKGLTGIDLISGISWSNYLRFYDSDGKPVDSDCPLSKLGSIVYDTPLRYYSIGFTKDRIYLRSDYNASGNDEIVLVLKYDNEPDKYIRINITAGKPLQCLRTQFTGQLQLEDNFDKIIKTETFTNNGPVEQRLDIRPYVSVKAELTVRPMNSWANYLDVGMSLPYFNGKDWIYKDLSGIVLGGQQYFLPSELRDESFSVTVPAGAKAIVRWDVNFTRATQGGILHFYNETSGLYSEASFSCVALYPVSYNYTVTYE